MSKSINILDKDYIQELTKDPYNFAFTGITGRYNERLLKDALLNNIIQFPVWANLQFARSEYKNLKFENNKRNI